MTISDGWMDGVERVPTPEFGYPDMPAYSMWPKAIMSHVMQGYQNTMVMWAKDNITQGKSAHFTIGRNGTIIQHVSIWDPAWHAGDVANPTWAGYIPGTNPNKYVIGIEHEGFSIDPGYSYDYLYSTVGHWPEAMIEATIRVHKWVFDAIRTYDPSVVPGPETIITHSMTNSLSRPQDPGDLWMNTVRPRIIAAFNEVIDPPPQNVVVPVQLTVASYPVPGAQTQFPFGMVWDDDIDSTDNVITPGERFHPGVDIPVFMGAPLFSQLPVAGVVTFAGKDTSGGNTIVLRLPDNTGVIYIHMATIDVKFGDIVQPGQKMGTHGQTGDSSWPHLHYGRIKAPFNAEAWRFDNSQFFDPAIEFAIGAPVPVVVPSTVDLVAVNQKLVVAKQAIDDAIKGLTA